MNLESISFDALHAAIFRLSERRRAGDRSGDELLGKLIDEIDRRGDGETELEKEGDK